MFEKFKNNVKNKNDHFAPRKTPRQGPTKAIWSPYGAQRPYPLHQSHKAYDMMWGAAAGGRSPLDNSRSNNHKNNMRGSSGSNNSGSGSGTSGSGDNDIWQK